MLFGKSPARMTDPEKRDRITRIYAQASAGFPGVPEITARDVMQRREAGEAIVLVDARTPEEQSVSVIPDAITAEQLEAEADRHRDATIVCYCTIGGRSGHLTQQLCALGFNAHNMPGSVLEWSHEGGEFVAADGPTRRVHTHSPKFDLLADGYEAVH